MGLFGDLFGSSTHAQTTTSTSNVTNTELAGGNIDAPTVYGTGNSQVVNVTTTDQGTVQLATDISGAALELGAAESANSTAVAIAGLDSARDAQTSSLNLVGMVTGTALRSVDAATAGALNLAGVTTGKALDSISRFSTDALDSNTYIAGKSLDSATAAFSAALGSQAQQSGDSLAAIQTGFTQALSGVNSLASQVSQSATQTTDDTVKKIIYAVVIGAALIFIFGKKI